MIDHIARISAHSTTMVIIACISIILSLEGCASNSEKYSSNPKFSTNVYEKLATEKTIEGDYHNALTYWKLIKQIKPLDPDANHQIRILQAFIDRRANYFINQGNSYIKNRNSRQAETMYLRALALQPINPLALKQLREIDKLRTQSIQAERTRRLYAANKSNGNKERNTQDDYYYDLAKAALDATDWERSISEIKRYMRNRPGNKDALRLLATAEYNYAIEWEQNGNYETAVQHTLNAIDAAPDRREIQDYHKRLRRRAADYYYDKGIRIYRSDINQAISWWEKTVKMNNKHTRAKLRLKKAHAMRNNMDRINTPDI